MIILILKLHIYFLKIKLQLLSCLYSISFEGFAVLQYDLQNIAQCLLSGKTVVILHLFL